MLPRRALVNDLKSEQDPFGRTTVPGVYGADDTSVVVPAQLKIAAAEGSRAAAGVNTDLTERDFL